MVVVGNYLLFFGVYRFWPTTPINLHFISE